MKRLLILVRLLRLVRLGSALAIAVCFAGELCATGYYGPDVYLDEGGKNLEASPEFYWELEAKRLAGEFHPAEKRIAPEIPPSETDSVPQNFRRQFSASADLNDFREALKDGRIKPPDPAEATQQHEAARKIIDQTNNTTAALLSAEFPSEFADYHRGAFAYQRGREHWEEARQAWGDLLKRPEQERHYRSVWAAFMLGKIALKGNEPGTVPWFQRTRELARAGFADSLGMAADSYGWEGRSEWKQGHPEKAAELFLTQLALGDESAVVSLKALIPDREPTEGMLNYGPEPDEKSKWDDQQTRAAEEKATAELKVAAQAPLLRRLVTAHILATASVSDPYATYGSNTPQSRCARWLAMIKQIQLPHLEDAEYLGWVAYNGGDYEGAAHWLTLSKDDTPAACWLRAKLQRRAGKISDAAKSMAQAWQGVHPLETYTRWTAAKSGDGEGNVRERLQWTFDQSASGDLGGLHLERGEFIQALDILLSGNLWDDAAFVAERVLTPNELKTYIDRQSTATTGGAEDAMHKLRYLLGRRLVREDRYDEARTYLPPPYNQVLDKYREALKEGADKTRPGVERARALFTAAWLARYDGMELMGTEGAPDGFVNGGAFEMPDLAHQQASGLVVKTQSDGGERSTEKIPITLKVPKEERQRLAKNKIAPDLRFHYRAIAAALAIQAAKFLPNESEELADVVNRAGLWIKESDEKKADSYYQILERRCAATTIGRAAIARHWFVDQCGSWSEEQKAAHDALQKELNIPTDSNR